MQVDCTSKGRKLYLHVPYDDALGCTWTEDSIAIEVDVASLLQVILPMACLKEESCCATRFCLEPERAARLDEARKALALPAPKMRPDELDTSEIMWVDDIPYPKEAVV